MALPQIDTLAEHVRKSNTSIFFFQCSSQVEKIQHKITLQEPEFRTRAYNPANKTNGTASHVYAILSKSNSNDVS
jgi:hypothetical protein